MGRGRGYGRPPWMEGPPFGGGHWHGGRRMRRGEIRFALLWVLAEGPGHGYELIGRLEAKTGGVDPRANAQSLTTPTTSSRLRHAALAVDIGAGSLSSARYSRYASTTRP